MENIINWLKGFPQWQDALYVDHLEHTPGSCGLFPQGVQVLGRKTDILGGERLHLRSSYQLRRVTTPGMDNAQWLLQLQKWVLEQNRSGSAPSLGENTRWSVENGKLTPGKQPDTGIYTLELMAQYWE